VWRAAARQGEGKYFFHGDLLITPELVVAGADRATKAGGAQVHAFDRGTGAERWTVPAGAGVAAALAGRERQVFAVALDGELWSLDLLTGKRHWSVPLQTFPWEGPAIGDGRVFAGAREGTLFALDAATGKVQWQTSLGSEISTSVVRSGDALYVGTLDGQFHQVDARAGKVVRSLRLDAALRPRSVPIVTDEAVFVLLMDASEDSRAVVSLDRSLERVRWRIAAPDKWSTSRLFISGHTLMLGTRTGGVLTYCTNDGTPDWTHTLNGTVRAIGGADDAVYVGTVEGRLFALDPPDACVKR
jgi:outer membrane protein assembly factor BamB